MDQPLFSPVNFFRKENFKIELNIFSGFQLPEVRKSPNFWVWFSICSQNYGRITKHFGLHMWNILSFFAYLKENSPIFVCLYQGVCHTVPLPFTVKSILMQKKNYENSNISPCKNSNLQKSSIKNQNLSRYS